MKVAKIIVALAIVVTGVAVASADTTGITPVYSQTDFEAYFNTGDHQYEQDLTNLGSLNYNFGQVLSVSGSYPDNTKYAFVIQTDTGALFETNNGLSTTGTELDFLFPGWSSNGNSANAILSSYPSVYAVGGTFFAQNADTGEPNYVEMDVYVSGVNDPYEFTPTATNSFIGFISDGAPILSVAVKRYVPEGQDELPYPAPVADLLAGGEPTGNPTGGGGNNTTVPEPTAVVRLIGLACTGLIGLVWRRRRRAA